MNIPPRYDFFKRYLVKLMIINTMFMKNKQVIKQKQQTQILDFLEI